METFLLFCMKHVCECGCKECMHGPKLIVIKCCHLNGTTSRMCKTLTKYQMGNRQGSIGAMGRAHGSGMWTLGGMNGE